MYAKQGFPNRDITVFHNSDVINIYYGCCKWNNDAFVNTVKPV